MGTWISEVASSENVNFLSQSPLYFEWIFLSYKTEET